MDNKAIEKITSTPIVYNATEEAKREAVRLLNGKLCFYFEEIDKSYDDKVENAIWSLSEAIVAGEISGLSYEVSK